MPWRPFRARYEMDEGIDEEAIHLEKRAEADPVGGIGNRVEKRL